MLTNAPAVFQALVNNVLSDMLNHFLFEYVDIFIFGDFGGACAACSPNCLSAAGEQTFRKSREVPILLLSRQCSWFCGAARAVVARPHKGECCGGLAYSVHVQTAAALPGVH